MFYFNLFLPIYISSMVIEIIILWGSLYHQKHLGEKTRAFFGEYFALNPVIFNSNSYNKVMYRRVLKDYLSPLAFSEMGEMSTAMAGAYLDDMPPIINSTLGKPSYTIAIIIFLVVSFITPVIILLIAKRIWFKQKEYEPKISDNELLFEFQRFLRSIEKFQQVNPVISNISDNEGFIGRYEHTLKIWSEKIISSTYSADPMDEIVTVVLALDEFYQIENIFSKDYVKPEHQDEYKVLVLKDISTLIASGKKEKNVAQ